MILLLDMKSYPILGWKPAGIEFLWNVSPKERLHRRLNLTK
jgi:hypothetical protein